MTNTKKIVLAEDNEPIRNILETFVEMTFPEQQYEVFEDGTSLAKRLESGLEDIAVVVTDNQMPGINGSQLIKGYADKVPMILHYGGDESIGEQAVRDCAKKYFLKGGDLDPLMEEIGKYL